MIPDDVYLEVENLEVLPAALACSSAWANCATNAEVAVIEMIDAQSSCWESN